MFEGAGCVLLVIVWIIGLILSLMLGAVAIATIGAWFLHTGWIVGWHAAWANPLKLAFMWIIVIPVLGSILGD